MQQGRTNILGKFSLLLILENTSKNIKFKIKFKSEVKFYVLWQKEDTKKKKKKKPIKSINLNTKLHFCNPTKMQMLYSHDKLYLSKRWICDGNLAFWANNLQNLQKNCGQYFCLCWFLWSWSVFFVYNL